MKKIIVKNLDSNIIAQPICEDNEVDNYISSQIDKKSWGEVGEYTYEIVDYKEDTELFMEMKKIKLGQEILAYFNQLNIQNGSTLTKNLELLNNNEVINAMNLLRAGALQSALEYIPTMTEDINITSELKSAIAAKVQEVINRL